MVTVYDTEGNAHERESVDARELVASCGWTMNPQTQAEKPERKPKKPVSKADDQAEIQPE